jgi:shikimate kinase
VGSGGRTVGRMLAQRLGVPFYGRHHLLQHGEGHEVRVAPHFRFRHLHQPR